MSGWLNAGVPVTQAAAWAGHSVRVLLLVYARCIVGQDTIAKQRIDAALATWVESAEAPGASAQAPGVAEAPRSHPRPIRSGPETVGPNQTQPDSIPAPAEPPPPPELGL
ncbi:hypothetical protein FRACA_90042 [Frankia canadensis]|uniref:Integrase n=1 Tax=Frankia canadensis TaxID=1836972 RepID=A0A2I2L2A3_9ACTN|nr:hypothetical protein FRACA_90042 [Frankia canadensis]SOU59329.1 hypothetical protein FRACA_90042 [Frankia canadensis]